MVIAYDDSAETIQPFTGDQRLLDHAIDSIEPTDRRCKLEAAYRLADAQAALTSISGGNTSSESINVRQAPDIYLFSDGRASDSQKVSVQGNLHYEQIGTTTAKNIAIVAMNAQRNYEQPTQVQVFARLANFGPDPVQGVQVQLSVDGEVRGVGVANLLPDRYTDEERKQAIAGGFPIKEGIDFASLELTNSAVITIQQENTEGDCLKSDDSAVVVIPPPKSLSVLLVTDGNRFLESGLRVQKIKNFDKMFWQEFAALPNASGGGKKFTKPYDVIVFDRCDELKPADVPTSGAAIYFGCVPPGLQIKAAADPDGKPVLVEDNEVLDWNRDHPILRHLNIGKLYVGHAIKVLPTLDSQVLVDGSNSPLVILHRENRAFHLIFAFDIIDSNMPLRPWYPALLYQTLQFLALGADVDVRPSYEPGIALRIPRYNLQKLAAAADTISLKSPAGSEKVKVPATGDFVLPALDKVGLYTTDPAIPQYENIAVSLLDPTSSNLLPAPLAPGAGGQAAPVASTKSRMELWWWLVAAAALPLLIVEWWVYTRRVHL